MGQNTKVGQSSYRKIVTPVSEKEELMLHYNELSMRELAANKKQEQSLFIYQVILVLTVFTLAFFKEKFYPSHVEWIDWVMSKVQTI